MKEILTNMDEQLENAEEAKARRQSHIVSYLTMFIVSIGVGIVQSGMWPYLSSIDSSATKSSLGWVVTAQPLGQMLASPILGFWANEAKSIRCPSIFSAICFICGYILYSTLYAFQGSGHLGYYFMMLSRFSVGVGSANVTLIRSYISGSTKLKERTAVLARNTAAQTLGFSAGAGIQAILTQIVPNKLDSGIPGLVWDKYTSAGWVTVLLGLINLAIFLPCVFQEHYIAAREFELIQKQHSNDNQEIPQPNYKGVAAVALAFGVLICYVSLGETIATPLVMDQYGIPDDKAVLAVSTVVAVMDFVSIMLLITVTKFTNTIDDRKMMIFTGFVPIVLGCFLHYPIGNKSIIIANCSSEVGSLDTTFTPSYYSTNVLNWNDSSDVEWSITEPYDNYTEQCNGCPYLTQPWCLNTPQITPSQLIISYAISMSGLGLGISFSQAVFSKILGPIPLGVWMGLFSASASFFRITGPIWIAYIYEEYGTRYIYTIMGSMETFALILLILSFRNMAPMNESSG